MRRGWAKAHVDYLVFLRGGIDLLEGVGLYLDIDLDDAFGHRGLKVEPLPHDPFLHTPPQEDHAPVAGRDEDKGAPPNDNDEKGQYE